MYVHYGVESGKPTSTMSFTRQKASRIDVERYNHQEAALYYVEPMALYLHGNRYLGMLSARANPSQSHHVSEDRVLPISLVGDGNIFFHRVNSGLVNDTKYSISPAIFVPSQR